MKKITTKTMHPAILILILLSGILSAAPTFAQNVNGYYANFAWTATTIAGQTTFTPIPDAAIQVCTYPANAVPCTNLATLYLGPSLASSTGPNPLTADQYGNFGFWAASGTYQYTLTTTSGQSVGPFPVTLGGGSSGGGGNPGGSFGAVQWNSNGSFGGFSGTGLLKLNNTLSPSIASAGIDYLAPNGSGAALSGVALLAAQNFFTSTQNAPIFIATTSISSPAITDSGLTSGNCVQAGSGGLLTTTSTPCGSGGGGGIGYPPAGVPLSTGSAWGSSYTVGTAANNLVQVNSSGQLPALNSPLLFNLTAANLSGTAPITIAGSETLSFTASPTFSASVRQSYIGLNGNITSFTLSPGQDGQEKTLTFCQLGPGNYTVTPPSNVRGFLAVGPTAGTCSSQHYSYSVVQAAWIADSLGITGASGTTPPTPTVAAGSAAGTSPTISLAAGANNDTGYILLTTGTSPSVSAAVATVSFGNPFPASPRCYTWPATAATQALVGAAAAQVFPANTTTSSFQLTQGSTGLSASTAYEWGYKCSVLGIPLYAGASNFPLGTGIPQVIGGGAWGTTLAAPSSALVGISDTQTLTNKSLTSPILTGTISLPSGTTGVTATVGDNTTKLATTAFVLANGGSGGGTTTNPLTMNNSGSGASSGSTFNGSSAQTISYNTIGAAPLASPTFTGTPAAPTATVGTNTTQIATTAFVLANAGGGGGASIPAFPVTAYGAVCDGFITPGGIVTTSGNPTISVTVPSMIHTAGYIPFVFTTAMVGDIIDLDDSQFNSSTGPANHFTSTISSVNTGVNTATLAANVTFTSSAGFGAAGNPGAQMRIYHTDNKNAIQAALNAGHAAGGAGSSQVVFPAGVCATSGPLTFYTAQKISGAGPNASIVMLANGSNSDMFIGSGFSSLTTTASNGGLANNVFSDIQLDGNKGQNTGSGIGSNTGTGDGVRFYGFGFYTDRVIINNFAADGWYSEWNNGAGDPVNSFNTENSYINNMVVTNNAGYGINYAGPHDGYIQNVTLTNNTTGGILQNESISGANGSPLNIRNVHTYQNSGFDLDATANVDVTDSDFEEVVLLRQFGLNVTNTGIGTLQLGTSGGTTAYQLSCTGCNVGTLLNNTGSGFNDNWLGGTVGTLSGSYTPQYSIGVEGSGATWGNQVAPLILHNGSSWPVTLATSSSSVFTITNGGANALAMTSSQQFALGPSVTTPASGTHLDLSLMTDSMLLPTGTTTQRPTGTAGMLRYNSTLNQVEGYYNSMWNGLGGSSISTPTLIYSAAGTALPTCSATFKGASAVVSDATTPTWHGAYTSGGAITSGVICSYNGSTYSWLIQ